MGLELLYNCTMEVGRGTSYWWPLVCEVLRDHDFRFGEPTLPGRKSSYFYSRYLSPYEGEREEAELRIGSFRDVWDEVYQEVGAVILPFIWRDGDFSVEVSFHPRFGSYSEQEPPHVGIVFMLTGGQIHDVTSKEARDMIKRVFLCFKDLYELCTPIAAEIYWQDNDFRYAPWALFDKMPPDKYIARNPSRLPAGISSPSDYHLVKKPLSDGNFLFLFDPIPIPSRQSWAEDPTMMGWEFLTLFEQEDDWIDVV